MEDRRVAVDVVLPDCCVDVELCVHARVDTEKVAFVPLPMPTCIEDGGPTLAPVAPPALLTPDNGRATGSIHAEASLMPRFNWEPVPLATHYELSLSGSCSVDAYPDCAFGDAVVETVGATEYRVEAPLDAATTAPVGKRWVWRVRGCNLSGCGPWSMVRYLDVGRLENDADGDGYSDLLVGAPTGGAGSAYLFRGSDAGPDLASTAWSDVPPADMAAEIGSAVAIADLDGDGLSEIIVGAPAGVGRVYVFEGSSGDLRLAHTLSPPLRHDVSGYGASLAVADLDGDGRRDLAIGAPRGAEGAAYTHLWGADGPGPAMRLTQGRDVDDATEFGSRVVSLGDVNGDGLDDVLIAASGGLVPVAHLYLGRRGVAMDEAALVLSTGDGREGHGYGASATRGGDMDGDGRAEVIVGADTMSRGGAILVYWSTVYPERFGSPSLVQSTRADEHFGSSVLGVADLDTDGLFDLLVGASGSASGAGAVHVVGSADLTSIVETITPATPQAGASFGAELASAGDLDGDGLTDIVVSAPGWDGGAGRVFVYLRAEGELGDAVEVPAPGAAFDFGRLPVVR
jgi:hypothetical protein